MDGTWTQSVLCSFTGNADGGQPAAGLIFDHAGNLSGTAAYGAAVKCSGSCGAVFKLAPNTEGIWTDSVIYTFTGRDGANPYAGLAFGTVGNLYGTTLRGGASSASCPSGCGVVFKLKPTSSGWSETVLHNLIGFGKNPFGPVILDPAGNIYGTASDGYHAFDYGLVFEITRRGQ
jgi:uncharacterized repeat protein (TIGR03803 family)